MHGDFKLNLMRMNLLKLGEKQDINPQDLKGFLKRKPSRMFPIKK